MRQDRPVTSRRAGLAAIALLAGCVAGAQDTQREPDIWQPFRPLLGTWQGDGSGFGSTSDVTHEWRFSIQGKFLELRARSVQRQDSGDGEIHEDVGFLSHDSDRGGFVFRQFLSEGFVNTFDVVVESSLPLELFFRHRESESSGGLRVQMRLGFVGEDGYQMTLDLAAPEKAFASCLQMRMKRSR